MIYNLEIWILAWASNSWSVDFTKSKEYNFFDSRLFSPLCRLSSTLRGQVQWLSWHTYIDSLGPQLLGRGCFQYLKAAFDMAFFALCCTADIPSEVDRGFLSL